MCLSGQLIHAVPPQLPLLAPPCPILPIEANVHQSVLFLEFETIVGKDAQN